MKIAIASGKGGTGKTTLAVNLSIALASRLSVALLDCDVEEPNCHLYLRPASPRSVPVGTPVPEIDAQLCTGCGLCARACEFNALLALPGAPLVMPELCHGCGVCSYVCPEDAISEVERIIGTVSSEAVAGLYLAWGTLRVGESRSTPVIQAVKTHPDALPPADITIIDAPPGVACPAVEALRGADYAVLVTEPTPFGLHDLRLAVETTRLMQIPCGVVVNRAGIGDQGVEDYCAAEDIPILLRIPYDRRLAEACSRGDIFAAQDEAFVNTLLEFASELQSRVLEVARQ